MRDGMDGGISAAFTMKGNTISNIDVPNNIIGTCLSDITVYQDGGRYIFVGREVPRYSSVINFYKLMFDGQTFSTEKILKSYVSSYQTVPDKRLSEQSKNQGFCRQIRGYQHAYRNKFKCKTIRKRYRR